MDKSRTRKFTGIERILMERSKQINKHGFNTEHDRKENQNGELLSVAAILIFSIEYQQKYGDTFDEQKYVWPANWGEEIQAKLMSKSTVEKLEIAGALIAGEIDRVTDID